MVFSFKSNSPYSYMRYGVYSVKYDENKECYLEPKPEESIFMRDIYDIFSKIDSALVDILNIGRICIEEETEETKINCAVPFAQKYGLLGFMIDSTVNPDFMIEKEVVLKEDNYLNCKKSILKTEDYFKLFFPFASKNEMSYSIENKKVTIKSNNSLQTMLGQTTIYNQLIYSNFYCEKVEWIIEYAKKMYKIFESVIHIMNGEIKGELETSAREIINSYKMAGVPYKINMYGQTPEICWQPTSLKQALDMAFGFMLCSEKNPIKVCKYCGKIFYASNPKAEYDTPQCRNKANVYKTRSKNK